MCDIFSVNNGQCFWTTGRLLASQLYLFGRNSFCIRLFTRNKGKNTIDHRFFTEGPRRGLWGVHEGHKSEIGVMVWGSTEQKDLKNVP